MHRISPIIILLYLLILPFCAPTSKAPTITPGEQSQQEQIDQALSSERLMDYVKKFSSEDYAGRLSGTPEYRACARWVAFLFEKWRLQPAGEKNTYLQSYPNPYTIVFVGGELSHSYKSQGRWRTKKYLYEKEYYPGSQSGNGKITAEVVYVGYGITAQELNYDDYKRVNVKGKIVLIEPEVPVSPAENPELYKEWKPYANYQYKIKMAVAHGAKGMLINRLKVNPNIDYVHGFMTAQVGEAVVRNVFAGTGQKHPEVITKIKKILQPQSFRSRKTFTISNFTEHHKNGTGYNVLGLIEGTDPILKDEVIIVGTNLDHVGFCYEVMPGANNNASGAAVMLGVAEALSLSPVKPKRSVLFLGLGSKEQAFKGAHAYLSNPAFPRSNTVSFLNMDMVGCGERLQAIAAQNYPDLWEYIAEANKNTVNHPLEPLPFANIRRTELDAAIFLNKRIPSITFRATGAPTFPHTTKDTPNTLTPQTMSDLAKILYRAILDMANAKQNFFEHKKEYTKFAK
jgi:hypothetical protein